MTGTTTFDRYLARFPWIAVAVFAALIIVFALITWSAVSDIFERRGALAEATELLAQLEGQKYAGTKSLTGAPAGSAFLEGPSETVAGAALLERVATAVRRVGGNLVSTQVDLPGAGSKRGYIAVTASCDVEQPELQKLLFDLEAGMPFLFVDELVVQTSAESSVQQQGRLRVQFTVSGQWRGGK
jgi:general secretion pathway protein M